MKIRLFHVDAFTSRAFSGNPAAVCPLESWIEDATMQAMAAENNLSETAFFVRGQDGVYALRWFTPVTEVDLCGHATLASAYVVFRHLDPRASSVTFSSASGPLRVEKDGELLSLDFPSRPPSPLAVPDDLAKALGRPPREVWAARDYMALYDSEDEVRGLRPDMEALRGVGRFAAIATARGDEADFVSRFFAPAQGVPEDPVTGSAHCTLVPYWAKRLGKTRLRALQVSPRGGELLCEDRGERVSIAGRAVQYLEGVVEL
jgi:PhzF family phenazine biosynthesis protein